MSRLAIEGGTPVRTGPMPPWPYFSQDEIDAATAPLRSGKVNYWTGDRGIEFERAFARYVGCNHAVALANGSVALELALRVLGVGPGDEVVVTSRSFVASASCAALCGARPVFADVDRRSQNITADSVRAVLSTRTRAIIAVHLAGWPCAMDELLSLARDHNLFVIEDCAQSHGARYRGRMTGSFGDVSVFSFCQDKIVTTGGEGGMLVTNDAALWGKAWSFKDHGKRYDAAFHQNHTEAFRWVHESFGTNWRMCEMQAAIGLAQLAKLPDWLMARRRNAERLQHSLAERPGLRLTIPPPEVEHAYYKFYVFVAPEHLRPGWNAARIIQAVNAEGVYCSSGTYSEIYREKAFVDAGLGLEHRLPVARELGETSLMFMVHPTLSDAEIDATAQAVTKVMSYAAC